MTISYNPALSEERRDQPVQVVPLPPRETLLNWLARSGRLKPQEFDECQRRKISEDLDEIIEPEIYDDLDDENE
jgi:hypothetical protein